MLTIAQRLILEEFRADDTADTRARAAFRVCEKLRQPLSALAGVGGFRSVLARAKALAKASAPWLGELHMKPDGCLELPAELEARVGSEAAAEGAALLIAHLLDLLVIFIGEGLTLRLVRDVWPKAVLELTKHEKG